MLIAVFVAMTGLAGAFASALLGIGGAILVLPLLLYLPPAVGLPALGVGTATALAATQVLFATLGGAFVHGRRGLVDRRLVLAVGPAMTAASALAAICSAALPPRLLVAVFAVVATSAGAVMFLPARQPAEEASWSGPFSRPWAVVAGAAAGTLVGLVGSGTFVLAPAFLHLLHVPTRVTIGSTLGVAIFAAAAAALGKAATGLIPVELALAMLLGTLPGVVLGARASGRLSPRVLRLLLAVIISTIAGRAWWDLLNG
ncbi:MAG TPA: sulfite exporter TauE/SafE family protein [Chloroflexota bacterium]|nr:sulfite exporter TauE/SafE family protein [Chloroflexota bacterium]